MALYERNLNLPRPSPPSPPPLLAPSTKASPPPSKLPRRVATPPRPPVTPASRTPATRWASSVANRIASAEKYSAASKQPRSRREVDVTSQPAFQLDENPINTSKDKPLPSQKPLPSRPIVRLSSSLSPTKDSRCLIDASEPPLHITSVAGGKHDWPALRPQSLNLTPISTVTSSETPVPPSPADPAVTTILDQDCSVTSAVTAATVALASAIERQPASANRPTERSSSSPPASSTSAMEHGTLGKADGDRLISPKKARRSATSVRSPRRSVLSTCASPLVKSPCRPIPSGRPMSRASISDAPLGSSHHRIASTDLPEIKPVSPAKSDSRPHSPSPASFSRPRPGSVSKSMKTASRIPIFDTKKATVVDVKKNRLSTPPVPKPPPSSVSRRLASPDALKILENGTMRRQLKRMPTDASLQHTMAENTWETESNATTSSFNTPSLSRSIDTSPEATISACSPETSPSPLGDLTKISTSMTKPVDELPPAKQSTFDDSSFAEDGFDSDSYITDASFAQSPPPTSPFTLPLQTIPSEDMLTDSIPQFRQESYDELVRALSHLEGKGSPPKTDVDQKTLLHMFGHVRRELEHGPQDSTALAEHAAVAEKYLAKSSGVPTGPVRNRTGGDEPAAQGRSEDHNKQHLGKRVTTVVSKWSESTPSDKALSPRDQGISPIRAPFPGKSRQSTAQSKASSNGTISIGYPSCRPLALLNETAVSRPHEGASPPTVYRRRSSPTLGRQVYHTKPGSVRAAREGMKATAASFAHTTTSATTKKAPRMPTQNTKLYDVPETQPRRKSSMRKSRARQMTGGSPKALRSQSKSRFVLDKINGIFSARRERKSHEIPPLPFLADRRARHSDVKSVKESTHSTPVTSNSELNRIPKTPGSSPCAQKSAGRTSPNPSMLSDGPMGDGFADSQSVGALSVRILEKAKTEKNAQRKARLLNFAKVLNDASISFREAQISAVQAQNAAKDAQMWYEMTLKSLIMLQKLASSMATPGR